MATGRIVTEKNSENIMDRSETARLKTLASTLPTAARGSRFMDTCEPVTLFVRRSTLDATGTYEEGYDALPFDARTVLDSLAAVPEPDTDGCDADFIAEMAMRAGTVPEWFGEGRSFQTVADRYDDDLNRDWYREYYDWREAIDGTPYQHEMTAAANAKLSTMRVAHLSEVLGRLVREGYTEGELGQACAAVIGK